MYATLGPACNGARTSYPGAVLLLSRYLLREFLFASTAVLLGILVLWVAADSLLKLDELSEGKALSTLARDTLLVLPMGVPVACVVGIVWSVTSAVRAREITAIRCAGIPVQRALLPILLACLLISILLGWFTDRIIVRSKQSETPVADAPTPQKVGPRYWFATGEHIFAAENLEEGVLKQVTYFKLGNSPQISRRIDAASAEFIDGSRWRLSGAVVYDFTSDGMESNRAESIDLDLGISSRDLERVLRAPGEDTLHQLADKISDRSLGAERVPLEREFHSRLAEPLAVLILVLLALPFAIGDAERGDSFARALLLALSSAAGFWVLWSLALAAASSGALPPAFPIWGLVLLALSFGAWRFRLIPQ